MMRMPAARPLIVLFLMLGSFGYGYLVHRNQLPPHGTAFAILRYFQPDKKVREKPEGLWHRVSESEAQLSRNDDEELAQLLALGYVAGVEEGPAGDGVVFHSEQRAYPGLNLYLAGHAPEAHLMEMDGQITHSWRVSFKQAFPDLPDEAISKRNGSSIWRTVLLLPDGDLLAIFEGQGLVRIDSESKIKWSLPNRAHHAVTVGENGNLHVLTRSARKRDEIGDGQPILEDFITILTPDGELVREISLLDAILRSDFGFLAALATEESGDIFHTNDIDLLPPGTELPRGVVRKDPTALVSMRNKHFLALVNLTTETVEWVSLGIVQRQHDPSLLPNGNLLVFDNRSRRQGSRAVEFDPASQEVTWEYPPANATELFSLCCGNAQRLPNGNTLILFTGPARAIEVTPDNQIAWEFRSPHRTQDGKFVAQLMQMTRLPPDLDTDWVHGPADD